MDAMLDIKVVLANLNQGRRGIRLRFNIRGNCLAVLYICPILRIKKGDLRRHGLHDLVTGRPEEELP